MNKRITRYLFLTSFLWSFLLTTQAQKPLHPPKAPVAKKKVLKPVEVDLAGVPGSARSILHRFQPPAPAQVAPTQRSMPPGLRVTAQAKNGQPIMIKGALPNTNAGRNISSQVFDYLEAVKKPLMMQQPKEEFRVIDQKTDELGQVHFKLQQYHKGVKVFGGQVWLHGKNGQIDLFNGRNYPTPDLENVEAALNAGQAMEIAMEAVNNLTNVKKLSTLEQKLIGTQHEPELVVFYPENEPSPVLAWHLHLYPNVSDQYEYFVDANTGEILSFNKTLCQLHHRLHDFPTTSEDWKKEKMPTACEHTAVPSRAEQPQDGPATTFARDLNNVNQTVHSYELNGNYFLIDASRPMFSSSRSQLPNEPVGAIWTIDGQNTFPGNDNFNAIHLTSGGNDWSEGLPVSAHSNAGLAFEYFRNTFGRNSINGQGGTIISVINVSDEDGSSMENAFWSGSAMFYGNGGNAFLPLAKSLDVAAHEMSHGVIQNTANLRYQGESGALNESFADIFGVLVDRDDWQLGEDVVNPNIFRTGALRDLANPNNGGSRLGDPGWQPHNTSVQYFGNEDNGGVHINSGITNRAFFLIANTIGREKAEQIYYRALTTYLVNTSQFTDLRVAIMQSAADLHGDNSNEVSVAAAAFDEVGIQGSSNTGGTQTTDEIPPEEIEANPGSDFIVYTDDNLSQLYVADGQGTILAAPFTETGILSKPSITDDGVFIVFVADDKTIHLITIDWENEGEYTEQVIQDQPIWRNVAVSRDGYRIAALEEELSNTVDVFDFQWGEWRTYELYNPTFTQGVSTGEVEYADVLEFDFTGEYVLYDALNRISGDFGEGDISYWDIGFLKVYDLQTDYFEEDVDNNIFKLFAGLPENVSVGNPAFSKNSPDIMAFEYIDNFNQTEAGEQIYELRGVNLKTGKQNTLFNNRILNVPGYSRLDDQIIFNAQTQDGSNVIATIPVGEDKISAADEARLLVSQSQGAQIGVWFSDGSRSLGATSLNELDENIEAFLVTPNPFENQITLQFHLDATMPLRVSISNAMGQQVYQQHITANTGFNHLPINTAELPDGIYLVSLASSKGVITKKVVK